MYEAKAANKNCVRFAADLAAKDAGRRAVPSLEIADHADLNA